MRRGGAQFGSSPAASNGSTRSESRSEVSMAKTATSGRSRRTRAKNAATSPGVRCLGGEDFSSR